jgi:ABC-type transport system substrate-binding protein
MPPRSLLAALALVVLLGAVVPPAAAAPDGTLTIGLHVTLVSRWLDPGETEALITPFMVLYALHDALVKPMPGGLNTPSLAESWTVSKDGTAYEFVIRKNARFHNGDPVTADDVKFSFERYTGAGAKLLKDKVKEVQLVAANRVRFVLKEPWPDFMASYGTSATGIYAYGSLPEIDELFQRQAKEPDRKQREALLHQIQRIVADQTLVAPIFQQAFIWGVGPRVAAAGDGLIEGYPYAAPCEDLKLKEK